MNDDFAKLRTASQKLGREQLALEVVRWLNQHRESIPHAAQVELLRILGVPIV